MFGLLRSDSARRPCNTQAAEIRAKDVFPEIKAGSGWAVSRAAVKKAVWESGNHASRSTYCGCDDSGKNGKKRSHENIDFVSGSDLFN